MDLNIQREERPTSGQDEYLEGKKGRNIGKKYLERGQGWKSRDKTNTQRKEWDEYVETEKGWKSWDIRQMNIWKQEEG